MWFENTKTGVKFDVTEKYGKQYFSNMAEMKECADPTKKKTTKKKEIDEVK